MRGNMKLKIKLIVAALLAISIGPAAADDISEQINQALQSYQKHDYAAASSALDAAGALLRQAAAEGWKAALPGPLAGWSADDAESTVVSTAIVGGGIQVSRTYRKNDLSVEISLIAESPMMETVGRLLNSGIFSGEDSKLVVVDGRKMTYTKSDHSYATIVGKAVVTVKGEAVEDAVLRSYLKAVNFAEIEKMSSR